MNTNTTEPAPAVISTGLLAILSSLTEEERLSAYVAANKWKWPEKLSALKPQGWDELNNRQKYDTPEQTQLMQALNDTTSEFGRSRQWWIEEGIGTSDEHFAWWNNGKSRVGLANAASEGHLPAVKNAISTTGRASG